MAPNTWLIFHYFPFYFPSLSEWCCEMVTENRARWYKVNSRRNRTKPNCGVNTALRLYDELYTNLQVSTSQTNRSGNCLNKIEIMTKNSAEFVTFNGSRCFARMSTNKDKFAWVCIDWFACILVPPVRCSFDFIDFSVLIILVWQLIDQSTRRKIYLFTMCPKYQITNLLKLLRNKVEHIFRDPLAGTEKPKFS